MSRRPPKPEGIAPSRRQPAPKNRSLNAAVDRCRALISSDIKSDDFVAYLVQTSLNENDRAAAILSASSLENILEQAIERFFVSDRFRNLAKANGALGSFSNKIDIAYALNMFGDITKRNFDIIRNVRNVFAHARRPVDFETNEVKDICAFIHVPKFMESLKAFQGVPVKPTSKSTYIDTCTITGMNLWFVIRSEFAPAQHETLP